MDRKKCKSCGGDGVQKFSDYTTMHGFREFYYAKSALWKIIWFLIIIGAVALSVYQLYNTIGTALQQPTTTIIQPLDDEIEYPPLKVCYLHWMYWVNWDLVTKIGFSRETTLYAMSFLGDVISDQPLNLTKTKADFQNLMQKNDFTTLTQFYRAISNPTPPGITAKDLSWTNWTKLIEPTYNRFCYIASKEMIKNGLTKMANIDSNAKDKITLLATYDDTVLDFNYIHPQEVLLYMRTYILSLLMHDIPANVTVDYLSFKAAPVLTVDNIKVSFVMPSKETFQSIIKITGTVYEWLNTNKRPCNSGPIESYYDNCDSVCYWLEIQKINSSACINIEGAVLFNADIYGNVCNHNIMFLNGYNFQLVSGSYINKIQLSSQSYNACIAEYCKPPCKQWDFASTVSSLPVPAEFAFLNFPTTIYLEYPNKAAILVISEVKSQTWESLIGNLGGIVGLWLGASIISIMQMFYLLCCEQCDQKMSNFCCPKKINELKPVSVRPKTVILSSSLMSSNPYLYCS